MADTLLLALLPLPPSRHALQRSQWRHLQVEFSLLVPVVGLLTAAVVALPGLLTPEPPKDAA